MASISPVISEMFENVDNTHTWTTEAYLHYKLTYEPKGGNVHSPETQCASNQGHVTLKKIMWPVFQHIKYFIPVQFICKFHKRLDKNYTGSASHKVE